MHRVTYTYNGDPRDRPIDDTKCPAAVLMDGREAVFRQCRAKRYEAFGHCIDHLAPNVRRREQERAHGLRTRTQINRTLRRRITKLEKMLGIEGDE